MAHIVIAEKEVPGLIKKLYRAVNLPEVCVVDGKNKSEFIIINTNKEKVISIHKLCRHHEHKRRLILWQKQRKR